MVLAAENGRLPDLSSFGGFATPERRVIFSLNDLDETLPAPWEWDVKRLAASFVVACRDNSLKEAVARDVATTCVRTDRESMAEFSQMKTLELWYFALAALRDIKISIRVETFGATEMDLYATWCGRALALSHARSGASTMLSGYMGKSDAFDKVIADFSVAYADQNERDHAALDRAVRQGEVQAVLEETV